MYASSHTGARPPPIAHLCAHLDTHRTPISYSSKTWPALFGLLVTRAFVSMVVGAVAYMLGALLAWQWVRWLGLAAAAGVAAFLDGHAPELGDDAVYLILDQVGLSQIRVLTADGLIVKRATHPHALELARRAAAALPGLSVHEHVGIAYTDAAVATKRGLVALTIDALPPPGADDVMHWHQMSDTLDHIDLQVLAEAHAFTWQILQEID